MKVYRHMVKLDNWVGVIENIKFMHENNDLISLNITYYAKYLADEDDFRDMDGYSYTTTVKHFLTVQDLSIYTNRLLTALINVVVKQEMDVQHRYFDYISTNY